MRAMNNAQNTLSSSTDKTIISSPKEEIMVLREEIISLKNIILSQAERIKK